MTIDPVNQENALRAASQEFSKYYLAAASVEGAFQLIDAKIKALYRGVKNRPVDFVSTDAIIYTVKELTNKTIEEVEAWFDAKSEREIAELRINIKTKVEFENLWIKARKFDSISRGGQKFVKQTRCGSKIIFEFVDNRKLEFDFLGCTKSIQTWLVSEGTPAELSAVSEAQIVADTISEITKWPLQLVKQSLEKVERSELSNLYVNHSLSQFKTLLVREEYSGPRFSDNKLRW
jgi:hypothetical protein